MVSTRWMYKRFPRLNGHLVFFVVNLFHCFSFSNSGKCFKFIQYVPCRPLLCIWQAVKVYQIEQIIGPFRLSIRNNNSSLFTLHRCSVCWSLLIFRFRVLPCTDCFLINLSIPVTVKQLIVTNRPKSPKKMGTHPDTDQGISESSLSLGQVII